MTQSLGLAASARQRFRCAAVEVLFAGFALLPVASAAPPTLPALRFLYDQTMGPPLVELTSPKAGLEVSGGLFRELNRAIAAELGRTPVFVASPRRRLEQVLQQGGADVLCYAHPAWAAEPDKLSWSGIYLSESTELIAAAGIRLPARLDALAPGRVGTLTGYLYPELDAAFAQPGVVRDDGPNDEVNLRKLLAGRTLYMVTHDLFFDYMLKHQPAVRAAIGQRQVLRVFDTRCALGPHSVVSLRAFDAALQRLRTSGAHDALLQRYR